MYAARDFDGVQIIKGYVRNGNETVVTCLEHDIDPLEYVFKCRDVVHMDNLLVCLKDLTLIRKILEAGLRVRLGS
jgi:hypothetical protein